MKSSDSPWCAVLSELTFVPGKTPDHYLGQEDVRMEFLLSDTDASKQRHIKTEFGETWLNFFLFLLELLTENQSNTQISAL